MELCTDVCVEGLLRQSGDNFKLHVISCFIFIFLCHDDFFLSLIPESMINLCAECGHFVFFFLKIK